MSDYFSDKDDQSFDMPNDDPSAPSGSTPPPVSPASGGAPDESGFGSTSPGNNAPQQDIVYFGILAVIIGVMVYTLYAMFFAGSPTTPAEQIQPVPVETPAKQAATQSQPPAEMPRFGQNQQRSGQPSASPTPEVETSVTTVPQPAPQPTSTTEKTDASATQKTVVNNTKLNDLIEENSVLSAAVRRLTDSKEKAEQRMTDLESEVDDLVATIDETKAQLAALKKQIAEQNAPKVTKKEITYHIQAVVEGRAWLQSSAGANITVKVGDELKGYGVVTKIDAVNSVIQTSSGKRIRVN